MKHADTSWRRRRASLDDDPQLATYGGRGYATLNSATHVLCRPDKFPKALVTATLPKMEQRLASQP